MLDFVISHRLLRGRHLLHFPSIASCVGAQPSIEEHIDAGRAAEIGRGWGLRPCNIFLLICILVDGSISLDAVIVV
jgi:hypothetical protein